MLRENRVTEELEARKYRCVAQGLVVILRITARHASWLTYSVWSGNQPEYIREELLGQTKPFAILKQVLWKAYTQVRKKGGSAGVDGMTLEGMEDRESDILYALWNRMSSGSYFPKPVLRVDIPKKSGGTRAVGQDHWESRRCLIELLR